MATEIKAKKNKTNSFPTFSLEKRGEGRRGVEREWYNALSIRKTNFSNHVSPYATYILQQGNFFIFGHSEDESVQFTSFTEGDR
jgi:hypothetical protein